MASKFWLRRCLECNEKLGNEEVIIVNNNAYHARHFFCCTCQKEIGIGEQFHTLGKDQIVCIPCFTSNFSPVCSICHKGIIDNCVRAADQHFHEKCFKCNNCGNSLSNEFYIDGNGAFVDRDCYWKFRLLRFIAKQKPVK